MSLPSTLVQSRRVARSLLQQMEFDQWRELLKVLICVAVAFGARLAVMGSDLSAAGAWTLFIVVLAAGLWMTEAIPAFAVALVIIALEIAVLGQPGGVFAEEQSTWQIFIDPWSSPLLFLFFGGFILAEAAHKTGLDRWFSRNVLGRVGKGPRSFLFGVMAITFGFSMFMSNTATTAMMVAMMTPVVASLGQGDPFRRGLLLGVALAANIGGMGTIIGTPPNAIAAGALNQVDPIDFVRWMTVGLPPAVVLLGIAWGLLLALYPPQASRISLDQLASVDDGEHVPRWRILVVLVVFLLTVALWMTGSLHGIPTSVVSFIPISVFSAVGVLDEGDIRRLPWDILILITGGLSLGVAVKETGLAEWLVGILPIEAVPPLVMIALLAAVVAVLSNFMSNTAAANILVPLGIAFGAGMEAQTVVPIALAASSAMCLPISTPPNAIVFSSGEVATRDFLIAGVILGTLGTVFGVLWCQVVL